MYCSGVFDFDILNLYFYFIKIFTFFLIVSQWILIFQGLYSILNLYVCMYVGIYFDTLYSCIWESDIEAWKFIYSSTRLSLIARIMMCWMCQVLPILLIFATTHAQIHSGQLCKHLLLSYISFGTNTATGCGPVYVFVDTYTTSAVITVYVDIVKFIIREYGYFFFFFFYSDYNRRQDQFKSTNIS